MSNTTAARVKQVIAAILQIDVDSIADDARFVEDLGAKSIQSIELVAAFEEEFDIEMVDQEALAVKRVDKAVEFIDKAVAEQHA
jgi:acyl carrier protein